MPAGVAARRGMLFLRVMTRAASPLRESDLYPPVKAYLEARGYAVKGEVGAVDVVAVKPGAPPLLVELKTGFSLPLFHQALDRLAVSDCVYIAVPAKPGKPALRALRANVRLARRLGLGVLTVRLRDGHVTAEADPGPYQPRKSPRKAARLLREFDRLRGDPNAGGATRHGIVTGYRQDALACARVLAERGPLKGALVREATGVPVATTLMARNVYGWFARVDRGVYALTEAGRRGLEDFGED